MNDVPSHANFFKGLLLSVEKIVFLSLKKNNNPADLNLLEVGVPGGPVQPETVDQCPPLCVHHPLHDQH